MRSLPSILTHLSISIRMLVAGGAGGFDPKNEVPGAGGLIAPKPTVAGLPSMAVDNSADQNQNKGLVC